MPWVGCGRRWVTPIKRLVARKWDSCESVCVRVCVPNEPHWKPAEERDRYRVGCLAGTKWPLPRDVP